ncbi:DUF6042 family protein [Streptomyces xiamenensis]|uniref:DUF6042 family protein n=1 Tax=Streptomyces xiamenensis TaxID=408015 RepID=UPI0035DC4CAB
MLKTQPMADWTEHDGEQYLRRLVRHGWSRMRPHALFFILVGIGTSEAPPTRNEATAFLRHADNPDGALNGSCWEEPEDEEERAHQVKWQVETERYAAHYGMPPLRTNADVLNLLLAAQVIHEVPDARGVLRLLPASPLPVPADVFPLDPEEAAIQKGMRIDAAYEEDSYKIISLFSPDGERRDDITTSLERLARVLEGSPHDARQALRLVLREGDFTASVDMADIADIPEHKVFRLRCDWERFDAERISVRGMTPDVQLHMTMPEGF